MRMAFSMLSRETWGQLQVPPLDQRDAVEEAAFKACSKSIPAASHLGRALSSAARTPCSLVLTY